MGCTAARVRETGADELAPINVTAFIAERKIAWVIDDYQVVPGSTNHPQIDQVDSSHDEIRKTLKTDFEFSWILESMQPSVD